MKAIAFDFDGVLFESVDIKTNAFRELFAGEKPSDIGQIVDYHLRNGGVSRFEKFRTIYRDILRRPLPEKEFNRLCDAFSRSVLDKVVAAPWVAGAREFLERNAKKYDFFVVSGTPDPELNEIVQRKGLRAVFKEVLGSPRKKDALLAELMEKHGLAKSEAAFVGDSVNDWEAARRAGVTFIWRKLNGEAVVASDFSGPAVESLAYLEEALKRI